MLALRLKRLLLAHRQPRPEPHQWFLQPRKSCTPNRATAASAAILVTAGSLDTRVRLDIQAFPGFLDLACLGILAIRASVGILEQLVQPERQATAVTPASLATVAQQVLLAHQVFPVTAVSVDIQVRLEPLDRLDLAGIPAFRGTAEPQAQLVLPVFPGIQASAVTAVLLEPQVHQASADIRAFQVIRAQPGQQAHLVFLGTLEFLGTAARLVRLALRVSVVTPASAGIPDTREPLVALGQALPSTPLQALRQPPSMWWVWLRRDQTKPQRFQQPLLFTSRRPQVNWLP